MKPRTATWVAIFAAGALVTLPASSFAQAPSNPQAASAAAQSSEQGTPQEHLRQADSLLASISSEAVTGRAKSRIAELKQRVSSLQQLTASSDSTSTTGAENRAAPATSAARGKGDWSRDVAAADRILTELLADSPATGAAAPTEATATGTSGTSSSASKASISLDEETRGKLMEVRSKITAFAAAMTGTASSGPAAAPAASSETAPSSTSSASSTAGTTGSSSSASTPTTAPSSSPSTTQPTAAPAEPESPPSQPPATQPTPSAGTSPAAGAQSKVDEEASKRALTAARDSLSQLTQLPAASQLTGEARTQVSQLISTFNELITTDAEWRASYTKLDANLTALIGAQTADESPATPASGTAGAVGTSGTVTGSLDPGIKAKLIEFRTHLKEFERAAGGASPESGAATSPAASPGGSAAPSTSPGAPSAPSASPTAPSSATSPEPASTPPSSAAETAGSAASQTSSSPRPSSAAQPSASTSRDEQKGHAEAMRHVEAIDAILNGGAGSTTDSSRPTGGTTGTSGSTSLDRRQIEQLRTHVAELKRLLGESR